MGKQVRLHSFENFTPDSVGENVCGLSVVEQHISRARNRVQNELFVLGNLSSVNRCHQHSKEYGQSGSA